MSYLGNRAVRSSLGRGRNVRSAMGYVADDHAFTRGPGAIASMDAVSPVRRQMRADNLRLSARRDAAMARMTTPQARPIVAVVGGKRMILGGQGAKGGTGASRFGSPAAGTRIGSGSGYAGGRAAASIDPVLAYGTSGTGLPGSVVIAPQPSQGNVTPYGGSADPSTGGGGGGGGSDLGPSGGNTADQGGGGGGDGYSDDIPDGAVDDGGNTADQGGGGSSGAGSAASAGGGAVLTAPIPTPPGPSSVTPSLKSVPTWAWWAIAAAGAWWLLRK